MTCFILINFSTLQKYIHVQVADAKAKEFACHAHILWYQTTRFATSLICAHKHTDKNTLNFRDLLFRIYKPSQAHKNAQLSSSSRLQLSILEFSSSFQKGRLPFRSSLFEGIVFIQDFFKPFRYFISEKFHIVSLSYIVLSSNLCAGSGSSEHVLKQEYIFVVCIFSPPIVVFIVIVPVIVVQEQSPPPPHAKVLPTCQSNATRDVVTWRSLTWTLTRALVSSLVFQSQGGGGGGGVHVHWQLANWICTGFPLR